MDASSSTRDDIIILVAKLPTKGVSKTRLYPAIGVENAFKLAEAMLCDVLTSFSCFDLQHGKFLYVPGIQVVESRDFLTYNPYLRKSVTFSNWQILSMKENISLHSVDLGSHLRHALRYFFYVIYKFTNLRTCSY